MSPKAEKLRGSHSHHPTPQRSSAACSTQPGSGHALLETLGAGCLWGRVCGTRVHARFSSSFSFQVMAQGGAEYCLRVRTRTLDFAFAKMEWGHEVARGESSEFLLHNWQVERNSFWRLNPGQEHGTPFEVAEGPEPTAPDPTHPRKTPRNVLPPPGRGTQGERRKGQWRRRGRRSVSPRSAPPLLWALANRCALRALAPPPPPAPACGSAPAGDN